jgi:hypothetical protein
MTLLVIACVVLGAMLAWGLRERGERTRLTARNREVEDAYVFVLAKRNDLAGFLTDPRTRLYRLTGAGRARGGSATIAWQDETRRGMLIGDRMPAPDDGETYVVWRTGDGDRAAAVLGAFRPDAGGTFYEFGAGRRSGATTMTTSTKAAGAGGGAFVITEETTATPVAPGEVVYETR